MHTVPLFCADSARHEHVRQLAARYHLPLVQQRPVAGYWLEMGFERLALVTTDKHGAVYAEFAEGVARHRREQGGGRGQPVAKAIGLKSYPGKMHVVDATAGLGRDAFVLASLGCHVTLIERSPVAAALLDDGLARATVSPDIMDIASRMVLVHADAIRWLSTLNNETRPDVVYIDPMFPETGKSAAAKKDMQAFQHVIGDDLDSHTLLSNALSSAHYRVVVKRPRLGPPIEGFTPSAQLSGKSTRFDIYSIKALISAGKLPGQEAP